MNPNAGPSDAAMTPAEKRIKELIDRWLTSIELHLQYVELSDEAYSEIQAWPKHDRPTRWVLELAKQKATELREAFDARHQMGDSKFADSLELMSFLANLVGAQHVDRFIPLAEPQPESAVPKPTPRPVSGAPTSSDVPKWYAQAHATQPANKPAPVKPPPAKPAPASTPLTRPLASANVANKNTERAPDPEATREMPKIRQPVPAAQSAPKAEPKKATAQKSSGTPPQPAKQSSKSAPAQDEIHTTIIGDAVRLIGWGRTWHELAELIARMADRPPLVEIRKILRTHRAAIEKSAKEAAKK